MLKNTLPIIWLTLIGLIYTSLFNFRFRPAPVFRDKHIENVQTAIYGKVIYIESFKKYYLKVCVGNLIW